ncbi:unnamed protein product [Citrullus colocynthis]|uniref:Pentatricopeptide repeat-containing protein n=1 Tax=Citrullus colocynthis TaxID=252529 RepID=A0ABP0Z9H8_9ROSI
MDWRRLKMKAKSKLRQAIDSLCPPPLSHTPSWSLNAFVQMKSTKLRGFNPTGTPFFFPTLDPFLHNQLLHLYRKFGKLRDAQNPFDKMLERDVFSWNALLSEHAKSGSIQDLLATMDNLRKCTDLLNEMRLSGYLLAYCQRERVDEARMGLSEFKEKDIVCWIAILVGHAKNGREEDALLLFNEMLLEHVEFDSYALPSVVSSCAKLAPLHMVRQSMENQFFLGLIMPCLSVAH